MGHMRSEQSAPKKPMSQMHMVVMSASQLEYSTPCPSPPGQYPGGVSAPNATLACTDQDADTESKHEPKQLMMAGEATRKAKPGSSVLAATAAAAVVASAAAAFDDGARGPRSAPAAQCETGRGGVGTDLVRAHADAAVGAVVRACEPLAGLPREARRAVALACRNTAQAAMDRSNNQ